MHPRIRRLIADHDRVVRCFTEHPYVRLLSAEGNPPEKYEFEFRVQGFVPHGAQEWTVESLHRAEVFLPLDYPRRPPFCRMTTPVFHPNINPQKICLGDHWSAGQTLDQLIVRIAEMICYQSYNVKSPLNAEAAAWAAQHPERLPLDTADLSGGL